MMRFCPAFHTVQLMKQVRIGFIVTFSNQEKIAILVFGAKEPTNHHHHHHHHHHYYKYDTSRHVLLHNTDISDIYSKDNAAPAP